MNIQAVVISDLYAEGIPINNQSVSSRNKQTVVLLKTVLIKVTGDSQISSRNGIATILANANQYVQNFEYRRTADQKLFLWIRFNQFLLDEILHQLAIPIWGHERPTTLIWLAVSDTLGRRLAKEENSLYREYLNQYAKNRGILLTYPLFDLQDTSQLKITDIWGDFHEIVLSASSRYLSDVVVKGRVEMINANLWEAHWTFYIDEKTIIWMVQKNNLKTLMKASVNHIADTLAIRYVQAGSYTKSGTMKIIVNGVNSYSQYAKILNYLASFNSIVNIDVQSVSADEVVYFLETASDISVVSKSIELGDILQKISENTYKLR